MNLKSLRVFVLIMEEGTLARAADRLNLSHSAASRLIQILEEEYSVRLFLREKKRLTPTAEAEQFYPEALRLLSQVDDIPNLFAQSRSKARAPLRILCHARVLNGLVLPALGRLSKQIPDRPIKLEIYPRRDLGRRIMNDRFDVGVSTLPLPVETPQPLRLGKVELAIAVARNHPLASRQELRPEDLVGHTYVALDDSTVIRRIADRELARAGVTLPAAYEVSTGAAAYRLVHQGIGFTFADPVALDPELRGAISLVPWRPVAEVEFGYFVSAHTQDPRVAAQFVEALRAEFAEYGVLSGSSPSTPG